jgi:hypothetical protein
VQAADQGNDNKTLSENATKISQHIDAIIAY